MEQSKKLEAKYLLKWGGVTGLVSIPIFTLLYITNQYTSGFLLFIQWLAWLFLYFFLVKNYRKIYLDNSMSFGKAFTFSLKLVLISSVIALAYSNIYLHFISPSTYTKMMELQKQEMFKSGADDKKVELAMRIANWANKPVIQALSSVVSLFFSSFIYALIVAAFVKKEKSTPF